MQVLFENKILSLIDDKVKQGLRIAKYFYSVCI